MFNKKIVLIIIVLFVIIVQLFGSESKFHVKVGTGNDMWNFGLSENYDDQLSYSVFSKIAYKRFAFQFDAEGYTNRGVSEKKGDGSFIFHNGRYDKFDFLGSYIFTLPINNDWIFEFEPKIGLTLIGDFDMQWYQNLVHKVSNISELVLPYDYNKTNKYLTLNGNFALVYNLLSFDHSILQARIQIDTSNVLSFETKQNYKLEMAVADMPDNEKTAYMFIGYGTGQSHCNSFTEKNYLSYVKGVEYGFGINTALISVDFFKFLKTGYGYTNVSFDIVPFFTEKTYKREDFWISYGKTLLLNRNYDDNTIGYKFDSGVSVFINNRYVSGYPILNELDRDTNLRFKRNYSLNSAGIKFEHSFLKKKAITLYTQANAGISTWNFGYLFNMDSSTSDFEKQFKKEFVFFGDIQMGITFIPQDILVFSNAQYQFSVYGGAVWFPYKEKVQTLLTRDRTYDKGWSFSGFAPYIGIGLRVGMDI